MRVFISCCYCHENWKRQQNEQTGASQPYRLLNRGNILNVAKKKKWLPRNVLVWTCINLWIIMLNDKLYQISQRFYCYCGLKKWFLIGCCLTCEAALQKISPSRRDVSSGVPSLGYRMKRLNGCIFAVFGEGVNRRRKHQGRIKTLQLLSVLLLLCHAPDCKCNIRIRVSGYFDFASSVV